MGAAMRMTDEQKKHQRSRNRALLLVLLGMVALFYLVTIVRWGVA
jgi:hypothetical protein